MPTLISRHVTVADCGPYDALLFDCDGTLADTMPLHYTAWKRVLEPFGVVFEENRYFSLAGMPTRHILATLSKEQGIPLNFDELVHVKERYFLEIVDRLAPFEPVLALARAFHGTKPMAVVSGGIRRAVERTLNHLAIRAWFGAVVTAEDTPSGKPHPEPFLIAAQRLNVNPARCLAFEDAQLGFESALSAGMDVVDVRGMVGGKH